MLNNEEMRFFRYKGRWPFNKMTKEGMSFAFDKKDLQSVRNAACNYGSKYGVYFTIKVINGRARCYRRTEEENKAIAERENRHIDKVMGGAL
jgi:hypothetical protein